MNNTWQTQWLAIGFLLIAFGILVHTDFWLNQSPIAIAFPAQKVSVNSQDAPSPFHGNFGLGSPGFRPLVSDRAPHFHPPTNKPRALNHDPILIDWRHPEKHFADLSATPQCHFGDCVDRGRQQLGFLSKINIRFSRTMESTFDQTSPLPSAN